MDNIDKIEQLFKANEVVLVVQLCKSQGYKLINVLKNICKFKENIFNLTTDGLPWIDGIYIFKESDYRKKYKIIIYGKAYRRSKLSIALNKLAIELNKLCK